MIIDIDHKCGIPPHRQIADAIALRVLSGTLAAHQQLPSVRDLALQLQVNPNTVQQAYADLKAGGLVVLKADELRVADVEHVPAALRSDIISRGLQRVASQAQQLGVSPDVVERLLGELMRTHYDR